MLPGVPQERRCRRQHIVQAGQGLRGAGRFPARRGLLRRGDGIRTASALLRSARRARPGQTRGAGTSLDSIWRLLGLSVVVTLGVMRRITRSVMTTMDNLVNIF